RDPAATLTFFADHGPVDCIVHLASLQAAGEFPARFGAIQLQDNSRIHLNVLEAWRLVQPQAHLVAVGSSCAYPSLPGPLHESDFESGAIHGSVYAYATTKRLLYTGVRTYSDRYRLAGSYLVPATMFGEHDDFHPDTAHVCGALIHRICKAADEEQPAVRVWGDGSQVGDLMDVTEFVRVLLAVWPELTGGTLVNVGPGRGTTIRALAEQIRAHAGFQGALEFDPTRYSGVPFKVLDTGKLQLELGQQVAHDLGPALLRTIAWYRTHYAARDPRPKFPELLETAT
ncbi:MAG: NAD-dependent epimerase/dehydratase family protein, partial [Planctomycetes bacterium]|nr:NAD-dependent epimerase/dehydratase family protein [Planctomycetota bacterium]